jgi:hypothetical protein
MKLTVEIFDGTGLFDLWQDKFMDFFFQQGLDIAMEKRNQKI